jgi:Holliday junction resolvase RusA-like endonuclease
MNGKPHLPKPDLDNLIKAICDAIYKNDSAIWDYRATKLWGERGQIIIDKLNPRVEWQIETLE